MNKVLYGIWSVMDNDWHNFLTHDGSPCIPFTKNKRDAEHIALLLTGNSDKFIAKPVKVYEFGDVIPFESKYFFTRTGQIVCGILLFGLIGAIIILFYMGVL